ncbi:hypothetical protein AArcSl_0417 [Halalkaliarchaeum desulfuricum]|uniref:Uncharacterized protein n=1 Tax=Halalkaliarchaeum desulfuricum TaxID=2055893 RepID=A0A343TG48_9EURY|nr:DUF5783 family protein [Halalkaliarchaeum desulfuricum]AUX08070.1 hypothetical protein AArcSl_0417 [Halalkaliarchaeum desulfuricum]
MADFDPEQFEDKYANYFPELQRAYKSAFETMNDEYDSELIHAIDQAVLNESEPFYREGEFVVELPKNPHDRIEGVGVIVEEDRVEPVLDRYVDEIEGELHRVFGVERTD